MLIRARHGKAIRYSNTTARVSVRSWSYSFRPADSVKVYRLRLRNESLERPVMDCKLFMRDARDGIAKI